MFDEFLGNALYNIYGDNSIVANENGDLFVRDPLGNDHYTTVAGTKGDWLLRKYGPDIVVRDTGGIAYARVGDGDWYISSLSRMPNALFANVVAPAYTTNAAPKDSNVTAFIPTGEEWYYRQAEELKREHPEWTMEQITNTMSEIIWNNNYHALINDIANSGSPEEREQKISAHQYELDKYEASGIGVTNDIQYLRKVQGMPLASMLDAIASFNNSYSYSGMESQYMYAPDHLVHSDAISAADSNTVLEHNEEHQTLWQVSVGGTPTPWQLEKTEAEQKMAESREEKFKDYIEKLRNLPFIQGASLTPGDLEAGYQLGTYDGRTYVRTRLEDGNWAVHPDDWQLAQESIEDLTRGTILNITVPKLLKVAVVNGKGMNEVFKQSGNDVEISNPLPAKGIYARVMPEKFAKLLQEGRIKLSPNSDSWVTAAEDLKGITSTEEMANKLTLIDKEGALRLNSNAVVEFRLKNPLGIASPINRVDPGFIGGGRTMGGAREFIIPSDAEIEIIGVRILE